MGVKMHVSEDGAGDLTVARLRELIADLPDRAVVEIGQNDLDDYRNAGQAHWWFEARWKAK